MNDVGIKFLLPFIIAGTLIFKISQQFKERRTIEQQYNQKSKLKSNRINKKLVKKLKNKNKRLRKKIKRLEQEVSRLKSINSIKSDKNKKPTILSKTTAEKIRLKRYQKRVLVNASINRHLPQSCLRKTGCKNQQTLAAMEPDLRLKALMEKKFGYCRLIGRSPDGKNKTCKKCACLAYIVNTKLIKGKTHGSGVAMASNGKIEDEETTGCVEGKNWKSSAKKMLNNCLNDRDGICDCFFNNIDT